MQDVCVCVHLYVCAIIKVRKWNLGHLAHRIKINQFSVLFVCPSSSSLWAYCIWCVSWAVRTKVRRAINYDEKKKESNGKILVQRGKWNELKTSLARANCPDCFIEFFFLPHSVTRTQRLLFRCQHSHKLFPDRFFFLLNLFASFGFWFSLHHRMWSVQNELMWTRAVCSVCFTSDKLYFALYPFHKHLHLSLR